MGSIPVSRSKKTVPNVYVSELFFFPPPPRYGICLRAFYFTSRPRCVRGRLAWKSALRKTERALFFIVCYAPMLVRSL